MTNHTPGPWQTRFIYRVFRQARKCPGDLMFQTPPEQDWPDCQLMAAAPDLLEALKEFDEACSIKATQGSKAVLGITELNRLWEMARAAIAKAKGE